MRAIVTGGASGIGAAVAQRLRSRGGVVVVGRAGGDILVDVTDAPGGAAAGAEAADRMGGLATVVNNAGMGARGAVEDNDDDEWRRVFDVNVLGRVRVARAALPFLREAGGGAIVNPCSVAATAGLPNRALYSATK